MNNIIGKRINSALAEKDIKQKELAKKIGVNDNVISYWCSGSRTPNTQQIIQICNVLGVSADYLLGLTDVATTDKDLQYICDYTGLDEKAIQKLRLYTQGADDFFVNPTNEYKNLINVQKTVINNFLNSRCFDDLTTRFTTQQSINEDVCNILNEIKNTTDNNESNGSTLSKLQGMAREAIIRNKQDLNIYRAQTAILDYIRRELQTYTQDDLDNIENYYFIKGFNSYKDGENPQNEKGENDE
ncbi:helix-turn-helix domain-containing protein [uncultured Eubacterium sp.]|uniref:helix-turn-helix transcriptional regulator n=1 Tax=uncultured Eubacterium sp. TaxID=165185 RepID=UPI00280498A1|nr:helix-turn-helix domain-containing protein [uncultured Eubacterium sp.]